MPHTASPHLRDMTRLTKLAGQLPTPFYAYDADIIRARVTALVDAFGAQRVSLHYAVKANDLRDVIAIAATAKIGACLVSAGEMRRALAGGMPADKMLMNGVGKTEGDIRFALENGIGQLNVESLPELHVIANIAAHMGVRAKICLRVNPEITATTHSHTITARRTDKFGLLADDLAQARQIIAQYNSLDWRGYSCHIGSQINGVEELAASYRYMVALMLDEMASQPQFDRLDLGGGFGVSYAGGAYAQPADYAALLAEVTRPLQQANVTIQLEPGRFIAAESGTLVTKVLYVKHSGGVRFAVVDAAMNNLIRPALYDAYHPVILLRETTAKPALATIVGPVCESADTLAADRMLPGDLRAGDLLGIGFAGAYGATMASQYNARDRLAEILYDASRMRIARRAMTAEEFDRLTLAD